MLLFAKKNHLSSTQPELPCPSRLSAHITQELADAKRQVFGTQQVWPSDQSSVPRRLFPSPEVATCTISCTKKVFEKQQNYACTLTAITWLGCGLDPPATFVVQMFRMKSVHALCSRRGGIPEASRQVGVEGSGTSTAPQDPAPGRQQYGRSRRCP